MPRFSAEVRKKILDEVFVKHEKVSSACRKWGISRFTFYEWAKKYKQSKQSVDDVKRGKNHYKYIGGIREKTILEAAVKNPEWTLAQFIEYLKTYKRGKYITSVHGVSNVLTRNKLKTPEERKDFARARKVSTLFAHKFSDFEKYKVIEEYLQGKDKISGICRRFRISRFTFYSWLARYRETHTVSALSSRRPKGETHWRYVGEAVKQKVIDAVVSNPTYSVHKLHAHLAGTISHHAVQNILARENLNTLEKRNEFAAGYMPEPKVQVAQLYEVPVPKLTVWRLLFAPFKTVPKWIIKHPFSWPFVFPTLLFLAYIFEVDKAFKPTVLFPFIALTFGLFFFLYSMKYYASLIIVMRVSQKGAGGEEKKKGRLSSLIEKYFNLGSAKISRVDPLFLNLEKVELTRQPFVSIHLAIYNEKRVIERLIEACQNQEWNNYEVILADDSTDETTEIAKKILSENGRVINRTFADENLEMYISTPQVGSALPTIKLIHRFSREGYKGGALQKALENTDARAEYISVFDSDFVPYPDTIAQFVKTFQESCGGLDSVRESNLAAVQGYQWHVLNKSQNWVTRGVRSEYAGNYVIERAGIGIYGGLNMIAGSVFCIRADLLRAFAWGKSITEDFELTLRLYERGYKVLFTPYIQAPAEAVSTVRRLIRQRMRWAEGHTFNIRKMASRILSSPYVSKREKSEFIYLAPYYLQAAFFIAGTIAWFLSEIVFKVRLPFWTAAWGWSLVFVNFLALPMMNLVGLFLEESEERDYLGIASFLVLSYILVPFQAYAAVKALVEDREGPWFRTPKTGNITDAFSRVYLYKFFEKFKSFGKGGAGSVPAFTPAFSSAYNRFGGYNISLKRSKIVSRGVLAVLLISVMFINYLAFFVPQTEAHHSGIHLEQQTEVMGGYNQVIPYSTTSTTSFPTDHSKGVIVWESGKFSATTAVYFEADIKETTAGQTTTAELFTYAGSAVTGSTVTTTGQSYTRQRSGDISANLVNNTKYEVRIKTSGGTANIKNGRLIVTQNPSTGNITDTQTAVQVATSTTTTNTLYTDTAAQGARYLYDSSKWNPAPTVRFEATIKAGASGDTALVELWNGSSQVAEVSSTSTTYDLVSDTSVTLANGATYYARVRCSGTCSSAASIVSAHIILDQTDSASGITNLETIQHYLVGNDQLTSGASYTDKVYPNQYTPGNFTSNSKAAFFEVEMYLSGCGGGGKDPACNTGYAVLYNSTDSVTINTSSPPSSQLSTGINSRQRLRSGDIVSDLPASNKDLSFAMKTDGSSTQIVNSWLIIQLSNLQVPEAILVAVPLALFIPKAAKRLRLWLKKRRKEKKSGGRPKVRAYV